MIKPNTIPSQPSQMTISPLVLSLGGPALTKDSLGVELMLFYLPYSRDYNTLDDLQGTGLQIGYDYRMVPPPRKKANQDGERRKKLLIKSCPIPLRVVPILTIVNGSHYKTAYSVHTLMPYAKHTDAQ